LPPVAGGSAPRPPHQSSYTVNSSLCICPQTQTDSFGIDQTPLLSCNYSENAPGFRRRKNYAAYRMPQTTEIITIGFNFFVCSSYPFCAGAAPAYLCLLIVFIAEDGLYRNRSLINRSIFKFLT